MTVSSILCRALYPVTGYFQCQLQYKIVCQNQVTMIRNFETDISLYDEMVHRKEYIKHNGDFIMGAISSQITSLTIVYSTVYSDADQRKHQSSASLAFVWGILRGSMNSPMNSPHKWPVTRKMFPFDDVIMISCIWQQNIILHWSAVITRSNITSKCTHHCRNWGRLSIRSWTHKKHPIPRPDERAMGCLSWILVIISHHSDVTMTPLASQINRTRLIAQTFL